MLIGYARVSKSDGSQSLDLQCDALHKEGVEEKNIYKDLLSGTDQQRPELNACLRALRSGDTLVVWKLDRLGRNLKHLIETVESLRLKDIGFKVIAGQGANIDTTTSNGRLIFNIFASLAEFERELIAERTRAGLEAARARGRKGGRPFKMTKEKILMASALMTDKSAVALQVAKTLGISKSTLYAYINPDGSSKKERL